MIEEDKAIVDAMKQLEQSAKRILFLHKQGMLLASLTDGDIRRCILEKGDLQLPVKYAANYNPQFLYEDQSKLAIDIMKGHAIDAIPIVDQAHFIKDIIFLNAPAQKKGKFSEELPVVIMAGGQGTRLFPYTNILPKALIPIGDYPIVEHVINCFLEYGCRHFYMVVNYKRNMIKAYFDELEKEYSVDFVDEEKALGTGGGISLLKGKVKNTFLLTNCDILIEEDLSKAYQQHRDSGNLITMVCSLKNFTIPYGVVEIGEKGVIQSIHEKPGLSFFTNTGCYFVEEEVIERLKYNEPIDFPSIIEMYMEEGRKIGVYPISENAWLDMGQFDELERMKERLGYN